MQVEKNVVKLTVILETSVCFCRDSQTTPEVIKITRLQEDPSVGPEQG